MILIHLFGVPQICNLIASVSELHKKGFVQRDMFGVSCNWLVQYPFFWLIHVLSPQYQNQFLIFSFMFAGLLALTVGCGDNANEILEDSLPVISQAFKSGSEATKTSAVSKILCFLSI